MPILVNGAGGSTADPILKGLGVEWRFAASTMDIATLTEAWIDTAAGFPGTNSVKASLSPAATVVTSGNAGTYNDTSKAWTISSTTGMTAGDSIYLSHASITAGIYQIASVVNGTDLTIVSNPLNGQGNKTGISYQIGWQYDGTAGTSPIISSAGGQQVFFKVRASDGASNQTDTSDSAYFRDALSGSSYISIGGQSYNGGVTNDATPTLDILSGWTNRGGISHVVLANHSTQGVNHFTWSDDSTTEKTIASVLAGGMKITGADGAKYGQIKFRSASGSGVEVAVDISMTLDTTGPTIAMQLAGR